MLPTQLTPSTQFANFVHSKSWGLASTVAQRANRVIQKSQVLISDMGVAESMNTEHAPMNKTIAVLGFSVGLCSPKELVPEQLLNQPWKEV
jgi:hypothetical protein